MHNCTVYTRSSRTHTSSHRRSHPSQYIRIIIIIIMLKHFEHTSSDDICFPFSYSLVVCVVLFTIFVVLHAVPCRISLVCCIRINCIPMNCCLHIPRTHTASIPFLDYYVVSDLSYARMPHHNVRSKMFEEKLIQNICINALHTQHVTYLFLYVHLLSIRWKLECILQFFWFIIMYYYLCCRVDVVCRMQLLNTVSISIFVHSIQSEMKASIPQFIGNWHWNTDAQEFVPLLTF